MPGTATGAEAGPAFSSGGATLISTASWLPWYPPSNLATRGRPLTPRSRRTECRVASVPELVKRMRSTESTRRHISAASSTSAPACPPSTTPRSSCSSTAARTAALPWPRIWAVWWLLKST